MSQNKAFIIIDVQTAMFHSKLALYQSEQLINNITTLLEKARASQIPVIFIQHVGPEDSPFGKGKPGWEIYSPIKPLKNVLVVSKETPDSFHETILQEELQKQGVRKLIVACLQTEFCVDTTCRRAFSLGYETTLVQDAHSTFHSEVLTAPQIIAHHNQVLGSWFVSLQSTAEVDF
jgi:nicotinamidase-related amidase